MAGDTADKQEEPTRDLDDTELEVNTEESKPDNEPDKADVDKKTSINVDNLSDETDRTTNNNTESTKGTKPDTQSKGIDNNNYKDETKNAQQESKTLHYLQNLKMSNSNPGIVLNEKDNKESMLLTDSKTVVRFSPVWRQVRF